MTTREEALSTLFKAASRATHPDLSGGDSAAFIKVKEAHEQLLRGSSAPLNFYQDRQERLLKEANMLLRKRLDSSLRKVASLERSLQDKKETERAANGGKRVYTKRKVDPRDNYPGVNIVRRIGWWTTELVGTNEREVKRVTCVGKVKGYKNILIRENRHSPLRELRLAEVLFIRTEVTYKETLSHAQFVRYLDSPESEAT